MTQRDNRPLRLAVIALLAPFALATVYLTFSRWPARIATDESDFLFLGSCLMVGLAAICAAPLSPRSRPRSRVRLAFLYLLAMIFLLAMFAMSFVRVIFGEGP